MKKMMIATIATLICTNAMASNPLYCVVKKFEGPFLSHLLSNSQEGIAFKGSVEAEQVMLIDSKGKVKLAVPEYLKGVNTSKYQVYDARDVLGAVVITGFQSKTRAIAKESALLIDDKNGVMIACSTKQF